MTREITNNWIKERILKRYLKEILPTHSVFIDNMKRKLIINKSMSNYKTLGYIFFALDGSPPKGCAIYQPEHIFIIMNLGY